MRCGTNETTPPSVLAATTMWRRDCSRGHVGCAQVDDVAVTIELVLTNEDGWVATIQQRTQTHTGDLTGPYVDALTADGRIPPTGNVISSRSAVFYRVVEGKVRQVENFTDNLRFFSTFGRLRLELF